MVTTQALNISDAIINYLSNYKAYDLEQVCKSYGIECNRELNPMNSKKSYIRSGLNCLREKQLQSIACEIIKREECPEFAEIVDGCLEDDPFQISKITRRNIIDLLASKVNIEGKLTILEFLKRIWNLEYMPSVYGELNAEKDILRHMINNDDLTYDEMFRNLRVIYISDSNFIKFLEQLVHPIVRCDKEEQAVYVKEINELLLNDEFSLIQINTLSGRDLFSVLKNNHRVTGDIKNIIFAPLSRKPDIVLEDSLSNNIGIINNENDDCLIYKCPISNMGLSWNDLMTWWNSGNDNYSLTEEQSFYERLKKCLDSEPEKLFMKEYYNYIRKWKKYKPALIPQVYCYYDPKSASMRNGQVYVHQRMDFLLLLPGGIRVVIEIDGKQHYADGEKAIPKLYAQMVKDDRRLKLYGYDVYRFGGYEFMESERPRQMIIEFIEALFKKYGIE